MEALEVYKGALPPGGSTVMGISTSPRPSPARTAPLTAERSAQEVVSNKSGADGTRIPNLRPCRHGDDSSNVCYDCGMSHAQSLALDLGIVLLIYFVYVAVVFAGNDDDSRGWRRMLIIFGFIFVGLSVACVVNCG